MTFAITDVLPSCLEFFLDLSVLGFAWYVGTSFSRAYEPCGRMNVSLRTIFSWSAELLVVFLCLHIFAGERAQLLTVLFAIAKGFLTGMFGQSNFAYETTHPGTKCGADVPRSFWQRLHVTPVIEDLLLFWMVFLPVVIAQTAWKTAVQRNRIHG